ncbi:MAG: DUF952 domain-containing protein [Balneolaceae bacterium]
MRSDLIFHIVSKRRWRDTNKDGVYRPEELEDEDQIECVWPDRLNDYLNEKYKGRKNLYILVIDVNRLSVRVTGQIGNDIVYAGKEIHNDAVLDKIRIDCGKDGLFDLDVSNK